MNLTLEDIRAFVVISELESFRQAGDRLAVSQSALSRRIQKIEDQLGVRLFDRSTRRIALTAVGREFLPLAQRMIGEFERSLGRIGDVIQKRIGVVTIASLMTVARGVLPMAVKRFSAANSDVKIRILDATGPEILEHVRSGAAEFGIDMEGDADPEVAFDTLADEHYVLACPPSHPLAGDTPLPWAKLQGHRCLVLGPESGIGRQLRAAMPAVDWQVETQHLSTLLGFLSAGAGVAVVPSLALGSMDAAELSFRTLQRPDIKRRIGLIRRRGAALSPAAQGLREAVTAEFAAFRKASARA